MGALIDASVLIAAERGRLDLDAAIGDRGDEAFAISAISASELLHGVHRADSERRRIEREVRVEQALASLTVLPFDMIVARVDARLGADLAVAGSSVGPHDLVIAATALAHGYCVITRDERSFPRIDGLRCERW